MSLLCPGLKSRFLRLLSEVLPLVTIMHQDYFLSQAFRQRAEFVNRRVDAAGKQLAVVKNNFKVETLVIAFDQRSVESRI